MAKKYKCKVELTTRPQADGKRLTFYPGDVIESKILRGQTERLLGMDVIEEIKKTRTKTTSLEVGSNSLSVGGNVRMALGGKKCENVDGI